MTTGGYHFPLQQISRTATAAIAAHRIVRDGATDGLVTQASATSQRLVGVADEFGIDAGKLGTVHYAGIVRVEYGGDVAIGDPLTSDAVGRAIKAKAGQRIVGFATETGGEDTIGSVNIAPGHAKGVGSVSLTIGHAALTDADSSQTFPFPEALPENACVVGYDARVTEGFTDGAAGTFTADLGIIGDVDQIADGLALGTIANLGNAPGVRPTGRYGGTDPETPVVLQATMLGSVNVVNASAGSVTFEVFFIVP